MKLLESLKNRKQKNLRTNNKEPSTIMEYEIRKILEQNESHSVKVEKLKTILENQTALLISWCKVTEYQSWGAKKEKPVGDKNLKILTEVLKDNRTVTTLDFGDDSSLNSEVGHNFIDVVLKQNTTLTS